MAESEVSPDDGGVKIEEMNDSEYQRLLDSQSREDEVEMGTFKWSDQQLATFAASVCLVPVVINPDLPVVGLGHFPYMAEGKYLYSEFFKQIGERTKGQANWQAYIFGGVDISKLADSSGFLEDLKRNKISLAEVFEELGIPVHYISLNKSGTFLAALSVDPKSKTVKYLYRDRVI